MADKQPDADPRLEIIRLEQEVRALRYQLEVKDDALRALNARLMEAERDVTHRVAHAQREMSLLFGPAWKLVTSLSRARQLLLPDETRRGRWWRSFSRRLAARPR